MALTQVSLFDADTTGANETVNLQSQTAIIANAFYGVDSNNAPVSQKVNAGRSVTFTVLSGVNPLVIDLVSTSPNPEVVTIYQGADPVAGALANATVANHAGIATLLIKGT